MRDTKLEQPIGPGMRLLLGIIGLAAAASAALIATNEFDALIRGSRAAALLMLSFCLGVFVGALSLLRASVRGIARVRRPRA